MKISTNTIKYMAQRYNCGEGIIPDDLQALVVKIGAQLGAVEEVTEISSKYAGVVVARVVSCKKHENSDHLSVCVIDDGGVTANVPRDENGYVQVVCGAPNVREGLIVAWLPPGTTVPESADKDPFVLEAREIRGQVSNGMLASLKELALGEDHAGIAELDADKVPGTPFAEAYELAGDAVIDIENKMFTHRPDCFGFLGVARELAGIQGVAFKSPEWYQMNAEIPAPETRELPLVVRNEIPTLVPRFMAVTMADVAVGPSPMWLQIELAKVGLRSINNIVDYTNFFMLETGQPLHAYDYDKVKALDGSDHATLVVRNPRANEKIELLNGKVVDPRQEAIMIATKTKPIGIAGVMGGAETEVDETTKNIIIEVATFDMYSIRRTSMVHGLFTDAVTRFNKGQSPLQNRAVLAKIVAEIREFANGKVASNVVDENAAAGREWVHPPVPVTVEFINARLGFKLSANDMATLLNNVEFDIHISEDDQTLTITAPFWRTDIETREDVVEEVGRLYGFDKLPLVLPQRTIVPTEKNADLELEQRLRAVLRKAGANEVLTYSFVHGNLLDRVGQDSSEAYQISNALSPDLQYYRLSLTPSLLAGVHANNKAGYDQFALFEMGKAHGQSEVDEEGLPKEFDRLALVFAADAKAANSEHAGAPYYQARAYVEHVLTACGDSTSTTFVPLATFDVPDHKLFQQMLAPFEPQRSAVVFLGKKLAGVVGEYRGSVRKALKLPDFCAGFELFMSPFAKVPTMHYEPLPRFPKVEQDICLKVAASASYQEVLALAYEIITAEKPEQTRFSLEPVDIYQREDDAEHKQITLRLSIASYQKTMTDSEVTKLLDEVAAAARSKLQAERI